MNISNELERQELIQQYIDGTMSGEQARQFKAVLQTDTSLQEELASYRDIKFSLQHKASFEFNDLLQDIAAENPIQADTSDFSTFPNAGNGGFNFTWLLGGLGAVGLFLFGLWFGGLFPFNPPTKAELLEQYSEPFEILVAWTENSPQGKGMESYKAAQFEEAVSGLEDYTQFNRTEDGLFYLGVSYFLTGKYESARTTLSGFSQTDEPFGAAAKWYLALTHLELGQDAEAKILLELLRNNSQFKDKANKMLKAIK